MRTVYMKSKDFHPAFNFTVGHIHVHIYFWVCACSLVKKRKNEKFQVQNVYVCCVKSAWYDALKGNTARKSTTLRKRYVTVSVWLTGNQQRIPGNEYNVVK